MFIQMQLTMTECFWDRIQQEMLAVTLKHRTPSDPMSNSSAVSKITSYYLFSAQYGVSHFVVSSEILFDFLA